MANEIKNKKELVDDEDRTADLRIPTLQADDMLRESDASTYGNDAESSESSPASHVYSSHEEFDRLMFDLERLRLRRAGLETEIKARELHTKQLATALQQSRSQVEALNSALRQSQDSNRKLNDRVSELKRKHQAEIRTVRFELTEAQDTLAQNELINRQLATDLVDTRGFKLELERMLTESERESQAQMSELEREIERLLESNSEFERELANRNETINSMLADISKDNRQDQSLHDLEAAIQELDERLSGQPDAQPPTLKDRFSRVLIGRGDGQEIRFPLFKKRLSIGRTADNDIQLQAPYISRRHAVVVIDGDVTRIVDWGSRNGVFVNSRRITEHFLRSGDVVTVGDTRFRYEERAKKDA
jgi:pSer/pThr/pTyr-binding forkhead associated (FHA) protein